MMRDKYGQSGFPFQMRVEVPDEQGQWWPQSQGTSYDWLAAELDEMRDLFGDARLVTYYGEVTQLPG